MDVKDIFELGKKNKKGIIFSIILGFTLGIIYYVIPKNYYTTGSLYITRKIETTSPEYFKYEGYYSQQNAIAYTDSVISILESTDIHSKTISKMNLTINKVNLLKAKRDINIKKVGPQIINVTVKGNTPDKSYNMWNNLVDISLNNLDEINLNYGDSYLKINKIENPITTQNYYPLYVCLGIGVGISFFVYLNLMVLKNYQNFKERK